MSYSDKLGMLLLLLLFLLLSWYGAMGFDNYHSAGMFCLKTFTFSFSYIKSHMRVKPSK